MASQLQPQRDRGTGWQLGPTLKIKLPDRDDSFVLVVPATVGEFG